MSGEFRRGRLEAAASAPLEGERASTLAELPGLLIEQILSGRLSAPLSFRQGHDEWVLLLEGSARLVVASEEVVLGPGEWLLLPAGCAHSLVSTKPGTSWLALHLGQDG